MVNWLSSTIFACLSVRPSVPPWWHLLLFSFSFFGRPHRPRHPCQTLHPPYWLSGWDFRYRIGLNHPIIHSNTLSPIHCPQSLADDFGTAGWSCWICLMVWWWWGLRGSVMAWMVWRHQESRPSCHPPPPGPYHPAYPTFSYPRPAEQTLF